MFLLGLAALIAAGAFIFYAVAMTIKWIRNKIREKLALKKAKKTALADIKDLVKNSPNRKSLEDLERLASKEGATHFMVTLDDNNEVMGDLELIKDSNNKLPEVRNLLGREGMVVVEK